MLLSDLYEQFERSNRRIRSPHTRRVYLIAIRQLGAAIGHAPTIDDLTDNALIALEKSLAGRSEYTINERTGRIKSMWRWAAQRQIVATWPTLARLETHDPVRSAWTVPQVERLLAACAKMPGQYAGVAASAWWRVWHFVQWETGERTGAMLSLRWEMVTDFGLDVSGQYRKGRKRAIYCLTPSTRAELEVIRPPCRDVIFAFGLSNATFYNHYARLLRFAGLPVDRKNKPQRMRRTHLTWWQIGGGDPSARAQHSSRAVTDKYYIDEALLTQPNPSDILPPLAG